MATPEDPSETGDKPGLIDRWRARMPWFDHVMRAQQRYTDSKGDFYAAGGFVLASQPELEAGLQDRIRAAVSGDMGQQLVELMDSAIDSRASVGLIGLATAAWAGLG